MSDERDQPEPDQPTEETELERAPVPADGVELEPSLEPIEEAGDRPLPVLAEVHPIEPARPVPLPVAIAAATGGFILGVATFVLVRVLRRPRAGRRLASSRFGRRGKGLEIAASRSFLVDVHLLKDR